MAEADSGAALRRRPDFMLLAHEPLHRKRATSLKLLTSRTSVPLCCDV